MPRTDGLTEKQKIWNEGRFPLIQEYFDYFLSATQAYIDGDQFKFELHSNAVKIRIGKIAEIFNVDWEEVAGIACKYHEKTHLLNGLFTRSDDDHLYFVKGGDFIKIGRTSDPKRRLGALQVSATEKLEYIKIFYYRGCYEFLIHDLFDYLRVRGEWFKDHPDLRNYIDLLSVKNSELRGNFYGI